MRYKSKLAIVTLLNLRAIDKETIYWMSEFAKKYYRKRKGRLSFTLKEAIQFLKENEQAYEKWRQDRIKRGLFLNDRRFMAEGL